MNVDMNEVAALAKQEMNPNIVNFAENIQVNDQAQYQNVANALLEVKAKIKAIEAKRKEIVGPINKAVKSINDLFRAPREQYEIVEAALKRAMTNFNNRVAEEQRKTLEAAAEKAQEGNAEGFNALMQTAQEHTAPVAAGTHTVTRWVFQVTDPSLVPREYLMVNEAKIRKVVNALKGDTNIPGVSVCSEKSIVARGR